MDLQPGDRFGRYELVSWLGRGGMAETWRARLVGDAGVTKPVLIKKVLPEYANDEAFISMFISEARISATLSHGNIAQVFDFGRVEGEYYLAMEFVDGQPLHRILKRALKNGLTALPIPLATFIALEMCRGLHYAHTRTDAKGVPLGLVHRDISPDNVLISYEGQVKIVDFGIAKARSLRNFKTEPGVVKGKYLFFSPEQALGKEVDARTDVWATGVVLYEMLCGQLPVTGSQHAVMLRMSQGDFPSPRQVRQELPAELDEIVMRALSVDLGHRYESSHAFADALAGFLYSFAPRFSSMNLAHLVRELFQGDLAHEGRELAVPPSFREEFEAWRGRSARKSPLQGDGITTRRLGPLTSRTGEPVPPSRAALARWWGPAAGAVLVLGCALLLWSPGQPVAGMGDPSPLEPLRKPVAEPAPAQPATSTRTEPAAPAPLSLDARRNVVQVPAQFTAFANLDPTATYRIQDGTRGAGAFASTILEPSPREFPPVFFLLAGEKLTSAERVGAVTHEPITFQGATAVSLLMLGPLSQDDLPERIMLLTHVGTGAVRRFIFHPEARRAPVQDAFVMTRLEPQRAYALKLDPAGQGVFLHGRERGTVKQAACTQWLPPEALALRAADGRYTEQPLQFLLKEGEEVRVRGIRGLQCGFIDDDPADNQGQLEVRLTHWEKPQEPAPFSPDVKLNAEADRLLAQAREQIKNQRPAHALQLLQRCLLLVSTHPDCHLHSGATLARLGRVDEGARHYRQFLELSPADHPRRPDVQRIMESYDALRRQ